MGDQWKINAKGDVVTPTEVYGSTIMQPVDIQSRLATTIQTHNAVSVLATTGIANGPWLDTNGFSEIAFTMTNDAATNNALDINWSHDGTSVQGYEPGFAIAAATPRSASVTTKARYVRFVLKNTDAAAHVMSAWAYLKA